MAVKGRPLHAAIAVLAIAWLGSLLTGLLAPRVMIGDEITHYYMLHTQAADLSHVNIRAEIPSADGTTEVRNYPHVFLWHYIGAAWARLAGGTSVPLVQFYHAGFWLQCLAAAFLLARAEDEKGLSSLLYLLLLASLPVAVLLSVAFYQDVPSLAQILTAFLFLRKRRFSLSLGFMMLALSMKETSFVVLPVYLLTIVATYRPWSTRNGWSRAALQGTALFAAIVVLCLFWSTILSFVSATFYPVDQARKYLSCVVGPEAPAPAAVDRASDPPQGSPATSPLRNRPEIANHPGDLRQPRNFLVYGGALIWIAALSSLLIACRHWKSGKPLAGDTPISWWALWGGLLSIVGTAYHLRSAPDARFFLPGIALLLLPIVQICASVLPAARWLALVALIALLQTAAVWGKTYTLRHVPRGVLEAIEWLRANPPQPNRVFMYPEGNYRLFPCGHDWYLDWGLKDFWKADNDGRLQMLHRFRLGGIVVKKYRVGSIDPHMNNLGVYPDFFVQDIDQDARFVKVLENADVSIYLVPSRTVECGSSSQ